MADEGKLDSKTLAGWSDEALEAELARRRQKRAPKVDPGKPLEVPAGGRVERALQSIEKEREIAQAYANLELPKGATLDDVEKKYKELSAKYAPEKHTDPSRVELARELRAQLTRAYDRLSAYLKR